MKIGIISDTHDQILRVKKAVEVFKTAKVEMVVHCGDIVAPFTLQFYKDLRCPVKFLFGNNTGDMRMHYDYIKRHGPENAEFNIFFSLAADNRRIAAYHGEVPEITAALVNCGEYDCVFAGHDHIARIENRGKTLFINPGTLVDKHKEGMLPPSVAIYDTIANSAKLVDLGF